LVKQIKPNFKALGPRFGKDMGLISKDTGFSADNINQLESNGTIDSYYRKKHNFNNGRCRNFVKILKDGWLLIQTE
jgi:hypothetical protein